MIDFAKTLHVYAYLPVYISRNVILKYSIRENKAHRGVGYDCLAEQYLNVELVIYLCIRFYRISLANYMMANFGKIFEECINFGPV